MAVDWASSCVLMIGIFEDNGLITSSLSFWLASQLLLDPGSSGYYYWDLPWATKTKQTTKTSTLQLFLSWSWWWWHKQTNNAHSLSQLIIKWIAFGGGEMIQQQLQFHPRQPRAIQEDHQEHLQQPAGKWSFQHFRFPFHSSSSTNQTSNEQTNKHWPIITIKHIKTSTSRLEAGSMVDHHYHRRRRRRGCWSSHSCPQQAAKNTCLLV